ncbi:hypothetical protein A5753_20720 [Mycobacterium sp. 852002-51971_SCH5477799-a]|uniref:hypothetical protein n=1 Tax=Mycobacterium sp. 852002-51971_SCH5477799-a TaxID=1834106 RepID=UPI0007FBC94B|nr:hypothetical protein [Mycobacterium sp. 852002-51971_SCH5477799-a]OBF60424.1 hypothetical protein A5753_20720 [Mycobacterium sp. 852002-51971_SCH5477799-a]
MGRHRLARKRRKPSAALAAVLAPAAAFFAVSADVHPSAPHTEAKPVISEAAPCCVQIVTAAANRLIRGTPDGEPTAASRYHTRARFLTADIAPEQGLQIRTILTARSITADFPQIHEIGGVRPDPLPWHPLGLALDVMIPDPQSAGGIALGNAIVAYVLQNADRFGIQDAIWRGVYYTPNGAQTSRLGHYDHVHVTTTGGGYPTGSEVYLR